MRAGCHHRRGDCRPPGTTSSRGDPVLRGSSQLGSSRLRAQQCQCDGEAVQPLSVARFKKSPERVSSRCLYDGRMETNSIHERRLTAEPLPQTTIGEARSRSEQSTYIADQTHPPSNTTREVWNIRKGRHKRG